MQTKAAMQRLPVVQRGRDREAEEWQTQRVLRSRCRHATASSRRAGELKMCLQFSNSAWPAIATAKYM